MTLSRTSLCQSPQFKDPSGSLRLTLHSSESRVEISNFLLPNVPGVRPPPLGAVELSAVFPPYRCTWNRGERISMRYQTLLLISVQVIFILWHISNIPFSCLTQILKSANTSCHSRHDCCRCWVASHSCLFVKLGKIDLHKFTSRKTDFEWRSIVPLLVGGRKVSSFTRLEHSVSFNSLCCSVATFMTFPSSENTRLLCWQLSGNRLNTTGDPCGSQDPNLVTAALKLSVSSCSWPS